MTEQIFIVTYTRWVDEGNNYAGWSEEKTFYQVIDGESNLIKWLENRGTSKVSKIEKTTSVTDVTTSIFNECRKRDVEKQKENIKKQIAELDWKARQLEKGL